MRKLAIVATLLLLGCGKSDRGISSGPYPCVSEVTVAGEGTCKPLVLTVDKNGQKVYVESDRVTSQTPATETRVMTGGTSSITLDQTELPPSHEAAVYAEILKSLKSLRQTQKDTQEDAVMKGKYLKLIVDQADWFRDCVRQTPQEYERHCDSRGNELYKRNKVLDTGAVRP